MSESGGQWETQDAWLEVLIQSGPYLTADSLMSHAETLPGTVVAERQRLVLQGEEALWSSLLTEPAARMPYARLEIIVFEIGDQVILLQAADLDRREFLRIARTLRIEMSDATTGPASPSSKRLGDDASGTVMSLDALP